jgi:SAM-dependent methyltransferase
MRKDAILLEEKRLENVKELEDYRSFHERHRVFPAVFENRGHARIIDLSAGVGCAAARIRDLYPAEPLCNEISPTCLKVLDGMGMETVSFDLDDEEAPFPFPDGHFDAVISLATIEHIIHLDHFLSECRRILRENGHLYLSTPNYASIVHMPRFVLKGLTFHDPFRPPGRYEFYAHVRYFTYRSIVEFVESFGFVPDTVYLPLPAESSYYRALRASSKAKAWFLRQLMHLMYGLLSPRWASEPVICFQKSTEPARRRIRKVIL